ncbi:MAG: hypothetical protein IJS20_03845 [Bacteroidales bacterium]|nr:hypothetical protein [Bacteroidales bacterium]
MKRLFILLLACVLWMNLFAKPYYPVNDTSKEKATKQFVTDFNFYKNSTAEFLYEKLDSMDFNMPIVPSKYAFLFACLYRIDGEFAESYSYWVYHFFKKHPEEYVFAASRLNCLPANDREDILVKLYNELYFTYEAENESKTDKGYFFKSFPNAKVLFPNRFIMEYRIFHDFALSKYTLIPVYVYDRKDKTANVRESPGGKVLTRLSNDFMLYIDSIQGKWCRIAQGEYSDDESSEKIEVKDRECWIHVSCLGTDFVRDGDRTFYLHTEPSAESKSFPIQTDKDGDIDFILDKKNEWVKVQLSGGKIGWVYIAEICGNPYTICG